MEVTYRNPKIYILGGKAQGGKSTTGKILKEEYAKKGKTTAILTHMKYVKDYVKEYFGWDGREETKPRELLQKLGTEIIRIKLGKQLFYINRVTEDIEILSYFFDVIVIDDARLGIEIDKQRERFDNIIAIKLVRNNFENKLTEEQKQHATEVGLDTYEGFDYVINNDGNVEDLRTQILAIIEENDDEKMDK